MHAADQQQASASRAVIAVTAAGVASAIIYAGALRLDLVNGPGPVAAWLAALASLFGLYAVAALTVLNRGDDVRLTALVSAKAGLPTSLSATWVVIGFALIFRLLWLPAGMTSLRTGDWGDVPADIVADLTGRAVVFDRHLLYDDDVWRFLWEGHVVAHGENPYGVAPADVRVDALVHGETIGRESEVVWDEIRGRVNHAHLTTIYPLVAQGLFVLAHAIAPGSVLVFKLLLVAIDAVAIAVVMRLLTALGRPSVLVILYAWNPLAVKAIAGSGHIDGVVGLAVAAAALCLLGGRLRSAGMWIGVGAAVKLAPVVLVPFAWKRGGWTAAAPALALTLLALAPFGFAASRETSGLAAFAAAWHFNALPWDVLAAALDWTANRPDLARPAAAALVLSLLAWLYLRDDRTPAAFPQTVTTALGVALVLGPVVMPWYLLWLLPVAAAVVAWPWLVFSAAVCLAFLVMVNGSEHLWWLALEYGVLAVAGFRYVTSAWKKKETSCAVVSL